MDNSMGTIGTSRQIRQSTAAFVVHAQPLSQALNQCRACAREKPPARASHYRSSYVATLCPHHPQIVRSLAT